MSQHTLPLTQTNQESIYLHALGQAIRQARIAAGYSNAELFSTICGFNRNSQRAWEKGTDMKISNLLKLAEALHLNVSDLLIATEKILGSNEIDCEASF